MVTRYMVRVRSVKGRVFTKEYNLLPTREAVRADILNDTDLQLVVELAKPWPRTLILPFVAVARDENWRRLGTVVFSSRVL